MKTKKIIAAMVQCISNRTCLGCIYENDDNCRNAILEEAKNRLMDYVAEIDGLKKNVEKLKKELAERGAARGWISVEERLPKCVGHYFAFNGNEPFICFFFPDEIFGADGVTHWMPIPEPPKPKVKTYKDVFFDVFPDGDIDSVQNRLCINIFFPLFERPEKCIDCNKCWNQPYLEEEGDHDGNA